MRYTFLNVPGVNYIRLLHGTGKNVETGRRNSGKIHLSGNKTCFILSLTEDINGVSYFMKQRNYLTTISKLLLKSGNILVLHEKILCVGKQKREKFFAR